MRRKADSKSSLHRTGENHGVDSADALYDEEAHPQVFHIEGDHRMIEMNLSAAGDLTVYGGKEGCLPRRRVLGGYFKTAV